MSNVERARHLVQLGRHEQAAAMLSRVIADEPDNAEALRLWSHALVGLGRHQRALGAATSAVELDPNVPASHLAVWWAAHNAGHHRRAAQAAEAAVRLDPHSPAGHRASAVALSHLRWRRRDAVRAAEEAVRLDPQSADSWNSLGYAWHKRRGKRAKEAYRQALARDPSFALARQNLAAVDVRRSPLAASRGLADALAMDPTSRLAKENFNTAVGYAVVRVVLVAVVVFRLVTHDAEQVSVGRLVVFLGLVAPFALWTWHRLPAAARLSFGSVIAPGVGRHRLGIVGVILGVALIVAGGLVDLEHERLVGTLAVSGGLVFAGGCLAVSLGMRSDRRRESGR